MIVEAEYEIREEEERQQKEKMKRFFDEFNEDVELYIRMSEDRNLKKKRKKKEKF